MNEIDNEIRVFEKDGEKYVIVNDLVKALKIKSPNQWILDQRRAGIKIVFYNGVYLIAESDAERKIEKSHLIVKEGKNTLLNQLNQVSTSNVDEDIREEEKYEYCLSEDRPFLSERGINFFLKRKKITYADLKRKAGINSHDAIGRLFDGSIKFKLSTLKKIAKVLGTTVSWIVIPVDEATDEMKANYQQTLARFAARYKERNMASYKNKQKNGNTPKPILNATKEAIVASLNKIDEIKVSMQQQFEAQQEQLEAQQEQLKILQAQLEDIEHESTYLRDALVGSDNQIDEDDYWEEKER